MASIQFTGLASGLDTDSMVKAMLMTQQSKIDNAKEEKEILKWKKDEWTKVNESVNDFYKNYVQKLQKQATFYSYTTKVSSDAVSAATSGSMSEGLHTFSDIKLAEGVAKTGTLDASITSTTKTFKELGAMVDGETHTIKVDTKDKEGNAVTKEIQITSEDTVATLERKLEQADDNLKLNFDLANGKVFISSKETGESSNLKVKFDDGEVFKKLGLTGTVVDKDGTTSEGTTWDFKGKNASYKYNGVAYTSESNKIDINGVKVTLERNTAPGEEVSVKVQGDSEALVSFMKEFVDEYNKLIESLNKKYNAPKVSTKLLTDAEKQQKTDKQIDEYEQNIKDSLLRRDESLGKIISTLRDTMQGIFSEGKYKSLSAVGITTGSYSENGKLIFDEEGQKKFKECVEGNLDEVIKLFTAVDSSESNEKDSRKEGIGTKLYKNITTLRKRVQGLKSYESYYNDKLTSDEIKSYDSKIKDLQRKYTSMESMYKRKFAAMEKALSNINSQSASFMSMLPS